MASAWGPGDDPGSGWAGEGFEPLPSVSGIYRALVRAGLIDVEARRKQLPCLQAVGAGPGRWSCGRWTWSAGSCWPTGRTKVLTGVDDHSRYLRVLTG